MRKFLALVLALVMTMSLVTVSAGAATDFTDDAKITNAEAVEVLNAIGILGGYADGSFRPEGVLTRGAGAKMVAYLMLGQEAADGLKATYTVFEDVTDTVGLAPYIEWAAANGIVGGYGNGKFGPYDTLTQYAFGKMLLTAIGYDSAKEGYTGAGWQKNVFGDAYAKGIYDGSETYGACTRDTAARMVLAALETTFVVYGDAAISNGDFLINGHIASIGKADIFVNGAWDTDLFVWETYEDLFFNGAAFDVWGNPGDYWEYDEEEIGFYEDEYVVSYTNKVDDCTLLTDLGYAVSSGKAATLSFIYNGDFDAELEAYTEDYDRYYMDVDALTSVEFKHDKAHVNCDDNFIGGAGVLTKVFKTDKNEYLVTEVATYLAEVTNVTKDHSGNVAELTVGYRVLEDYGLAADTFGDDTLGSHDLHTDIDDTKLVLNLATSDYAKKDMVLVTVNVENDWETDKDADTDEFIVDDELATATTGKLTGYTKAVDAAPEASVTKVDKVSKFDAFGFADMYGYDDTKNIAKTDESYAFYYDSYGNVIGMFDLDAVASYLVVDAVWTDHVTKNGRMTIGADVVTLDAAMAEAVNVAKFNGTKAADADELSLYENYKLNDSCYYYLYNYSVTDGDYTIAKASTDNINWYWFGSSYENASFTVGDNDLYYNENGTDGEIQLTKSTEILMRDVNGNYTAAVGYKDEALKSLTAKSVEVILDGETGFAEVVFLNGVTFLDAYVTGYIVDTDALNVDVIDGVKYYVYNFYIGADKTEIFVKAADAADNVKFYGLYEAQFNAVGGNLVVGDLKTDVTSILGYGAGDAEGDYARAQINYVGTDLIKMTDVNTNDPIAEELDDVAVYVVDMTSGGTKLYAGDKTDLAKDQYVDVARDEDGYLTALYILKF